MVFPSVPVYLDPPNWNQQQAQHPGSGGGGGGGEEFHHLPPGAAPPIRPASTADRARLAKVPQPEQPLKCPRCDSPNTKFCYFNNYSLSQPRHFCKTCRRYWTRGGALRNVPVGGGCRRNKRSKAGGGSSSKPQPTTATDRPSSSSTGAIAATISAPPQLPFMSCLQTIPEYTGLNMGFSFQGMQPVEAGEFDRYQVGGSSSVGLDQWRIQQIQQFPFLGGLEAGGQAPVQGLYPFDGEGFLGQVHGGKGSSAGLITQMASVKMEDNSQGLNMARQYLGGSRNDQFWGGSSGGGGSNGGGWMTDLSGFNSSSSNNLM